MENTKTVISLAEKHARNYFVDSDNWEGIINSYQEAIDEATADLRAQLAERDAQLAEERARLHDLLERSYGILENVAIADSGDAEQDAFERETFEDVKRELGK